MKSKNYELLKRIVVLILVINGIFSVISIINKTKIYDSKFDNVTVNSIIENPNESIFIWNSGSTTNEREMMISLYKLAGNTERGSLVSDTGIIKTNVQNKKGRVKLLLVDENKKAVLFEELTQEMKTTHIDPGTYKVIIIGKSYTGKVYVTAE